MANGFKRKAGEDLRQTEEGRRHRHTEEKMRGKGRQKLE